MKSALLVAVAVGVLASLSSAQQEGAEPALPAEWAAKMSWRNIGPANMSGRITDLAVYEADPTTWWAASASGGLLKTTNDGITFEHQFDDQPTVSVGAVAVAQSDPNIVWVGTGESNPRNSVSWGDGVYKSTDAGATWKNMGLEESYQIGRIAIHPTDPNIVYVGALGRLWGPNEERGLYKTTDAGETWDRVLYVDELTGIVDVNLDPSDPDTIIAATYERKRDGFDTNDPEKRWGPGSGIWKSTDAGASWTQLEGGLPTNHIGRIDVEYYRADPSIVYALVESSKIGTEPEDAPYIGVEGENADVGARITEVADEGPAKRYGIQQGDIVVALEGEIVQSYADMIAKIRTHSAGDTVLFEVSRERKPVQIELTFDQRPGAREDENAEEEEEPAPRRGQGRSPFMGSLGGQIENVQDQQGKEGHEYGGLYKSTDAGETWTRINSVNPRPMYFSQLRVDPSNDDYIYVLGVALYKSEDNGETFADDGHRGRNGSTHVDHHAMWIDPADGRHILLGNDGGVYATRDRMTNWDHHNQFTISQFYHVAVGPRRNYFVYGGLQDNGTWGGPNRVSSDSGPINEDWFRVGGGDGFLCAVDPNDPDQFYYESQNGGMGRWNIRTGERGSNRPRAPRGTSYRWNWRTPFMLSHHNGQVFYCAGNYVFRSMSKGDNATAISPEITNTDRGSATALDESPLDPNVIYVGTDDGALWMTKDGGKNWIDLFPGHKQEPETEADDDDREIAGAESSDAEAEATPDAAPAAEQPAVIAAEAPAEQPQTEQPARARRGTGGERPTQEQIEQFRQRRGAGGTEGQFQRRRNQDGQPGQRGPRAETPDQPADPIAGDWSAKPTGEQRGFGGAEFDFTFTRNDEGVYAGTMRTDFGDGDITNIAFDAETGALTFTVDRGQFTLNYTAAVESDSMTGQADAGRFTIEFEATRGGAKAATPAGPPLNELVDGPRWVSGLEASEYEAGRVYLTLDGHRSDDDAPHIYVSEDFGTSWTDLGATLPGDCGSTRVVREDFRNPDVLYLGTEFDLFVSIDRGRTWTSITDNTNLPTVAVHEIAQHDASGDLILATHGRGVWIASGDPIRQLTSEAMAERVHLYEPADVLYWQSTPRRGSTLRRFEGSNDQTEAEIFYSLGRGVRSVSLQVYDHTGEVIRELEAPAETGLNRVQWDLRLGGQGGRRFAPRVAPGDYRIVLKADDQTLSTTLTVGADPNQPDAVLWGEQYELWQEIQREIDAGDEDADQEDQPRID